MNLSTMTCKIMAKKSFRGSGEWRDGGRFVALPHVVIDSPSHRALNHAARSLLVDIARQYTGRNNGKLVACNKALKPLGWTSHQSVTRALQELIEAKLLTETRKGARPNRAAWFALGFIRLEVTDGLDIDPK